MKCRREAASLALEIISHPPTRKSSLGMQQLFVKFHSIFVFTEKLFSAWGGGTEAGWLAERAGFSLQGRCRMSLSGSGAFMGQMADTPWGETQTVVGWRLVLWVS